MRRVAAILVLLFPCLVLGSTAPAPAGSFQFALVDVPGAISVEANGINNKGTIVGSYRDAAGIHGFVREPDGTSRAINIPDAIFTSATGINDDGQIVGIYQEGSGATHAFAYTGAPRTFDVPGAGATCAAGINDLGQIVGSFGARCPSGTTQGFLLSKQGFAPALVFHTSAATASSTSLSGINRAGEIVGHYKDSHGSIHGFLLAGGSFSPIDAPDATATFPLGVNADGQIVGGYTDSSGATHGFVLAGGTRWVMPVDFPRDASVIAYTQLNGVNDTGQVVGTYLGSDGLFHGFVAIVTP
jgi:probable HAF family extracellular repeat protein